VGRHRQFVKEEVLEKATKVFIEKGFEATSIQDLIDEMGINRASLYDTFGDKENLFLQVLDRYDDMMYAELAACLNAQPSTVVGLRTWFYRVVEQGANKKHPGCLMVNSTVERALRDEDCAARTARNFRRSASDYQTLKDIADIALSNIK
jgi:TetR/AcrR family transcriptional repressor of nem operon